MIDNVFFYLAPDGLFVRSYWRDGNCSPGMLQYGHPLARELLSVMMKLKSHFSSFFLLSCSSSFSLIIMHGFAKRHRCCKVYVNNVGGLTLILVYILLSLIIWPINQHYVERNQTMIRTLKLTNVVSVWTT